MDRIIRTCRQAENNYFIRCEIEWSKGKLNVHFIEIGYCCDVHQIDDGEIFHFLCDAVKYFVHFHARWVPIVTKADYLQIERTLNEKKVIRSFW